MQIHRQEAVSETKVVFPLGMEKGGPSLFESGMMAIPGTAHIRMIDRTSIMILHRAK